MPQLPGKPVSVSGGTGLWTRLGTAGQNHRLTLTGPSLCPHFEYAALLFHCQNLCIVRLFYQMLPCKALHLQPQRIGNGGCLSAVGIQITVPVLDENPQLFKKGNCVLCRKSFQHFFNQPWVFPSITGQFLPAVRKVAPPIARRQKLFPCLSVFLCQRHLCAPSGRHDRRHKSGSAASDHDHSLQIHTSLFLRFVTSLLPDAGFPLPDPEADRFPGLSALHRSVPAFQTPDLRFMRAASRFLPP